MPTSPAAWPGTSRRSPSKGNGPHYQRIAAALERVRTPVPPPAEIARRYGVSLTTAHFVQRALHTRRYAASRRGLARIELPAREGDQLLWHVVAENLRNRIHAGQLKDQIGNRADLATQYGVSIATVNKAVAALLTEGLLTSGPRRGAITVHPGKATKQAH
ncbi:GntR family transcriptional regulator [Streptomyces sp. 4.24]|uniref:GntR family transcriptional regulator n=1 Tax=Streptomyces tritrimontium TaxID=3406573 RepID=UPI003BB772B9